MSLLLQIACLYAAPDLGHRDWRVRERTQHTLYYAGEFARPALDVAVAKGDAETRGRAGQLLRHLEYLPHVLLEKVLQDEYRPWLILDDGYYGGVVQEYLSRARADGYTQFAPQFMVWRHATLLWAEDQLRDGVPAARIMGRVRVMREQEILCKE